MLNLLSVNFKTILSCTKKFNLNLLSAFTIYGKILNVFNFNIYRFRFLNYNKSKNIFTFYEKHKKFTENDNNFNGNAMNKLVNGYNNENNKRLKESSKQLSTTTSATTMDSNDCFESVDKFWIVYDKTVMKLR